MNTRERKHFINELVEAVRKDLIAECPKYPKEWDGIELRMRIRDAYAQVVFGGYDNRRRVREYKNTCIVNNFK